MHDQSYLFRISQTLTVLIFSVMSGMLGQFIWTVAAPIAHWVIGIFIVIAFIFWVIWASFFWKRSALYFDQPEWYPWMLLSAAILSACHGYYFWGN